ncbi:RICIN domain-containing protein [Nonomuraea sp. 10N515B]|uniref:RICIN domain-containing protein n=1 Tax=Nonomuraea sp. 10N515B TaxID=3457422 RepID=UPI003FCD6AB0
MSTINRKVRSTSVVLVTAAVFLTGTASAVSSAVASSSVSSTLIGNLHSGKCLEILGWSTADWAEAGQWTCHGGNNQQWNYSYTTGLIQNVHSGKCLEILGWSTADGASGRSMDLPRGEQPAVVHGHVHRTDRERPQRQVLGSPWLEHGRLGPGRPVDLSRGEQPAVALEVNLR